jgi:MoaA/NifB/PqqE/SkfB family radical SAM enzyme
MTYDYYNDFLGFQVRGYPNIETSSVCILHCEMCFRSKMFEDKRSTDKMEYDDSLKNTQVLTLENFEKFLYFFKSITLCGNYSDPVYWKNILPALEFAKENYPRTRIKINTAAHAPNMEWYKKAFAIGGHVAWTFGVDGDPSVAETYRKGQKSQMIIDAMKLGVHMKQDITWQYIAMSYNEHLIEKCKKEALDNGIHFLLVYSDRWDSTKNTGSITLIDAQKRHKKLELFRA